MRRSLGKRGILSKIKHKHFRNCYRKTVILCKFYVAFIVVLIVRVKIYVVGKYGYFRTMFEKIMNIIFTVL